MTFCQSFVSLFMLLTIPTPKYKVLYSIVSPAMLALTAVLLLNFLSVCLSQNRKSVDKSIQSIFQLLVLDRKHCDTKQVSHELKFKKTFCMLLLLLFRDVCFKPWSNQFWF